MRPLFAGVANGYTPQGFAPHDTQRIPASEANRMSGVTHLVPNPTNPGYAYGTVIPLNAYGVGMIRWIQPRLLPVFKTFSNQIRMKPQIQGVTMDATRQQRIPGSVTNVPGYDYSALGAIQQKLAQTRR
jgi:hypothetical protein